MSDNKTEEGKPFGVNVGRHGCYGRAAGAGFLALGIAAAGAYNAVQNPRAAGEDFRELAGHTWELVKDTGEFVAGALEGSTPDNKPTTPPTTDADFTGNPTACGTVDLGETVLGVTLGLGIDGGNISVDQPGKSFKVFSFSEITQPDSPASIVDVGTVVCPHP